MGIWAIPQTGTAVWVEFEQGDPDYPIWSGCFYRSAQEIPSSVALSPASSTLIQTAAKNILMLSDNPPPDGGITLKSSGGATISINDQGITLSNGKGATITLKGNKVDINEGALTIT